MNTPDMTPRIREAIELAIAESPQAASFGIVPRFDKMSTVAGGWSVPLASGIAQGSVYELLRVVNQIQERVEKALDLNVTLFVDPRLGAQNGTH